MKKETIMGNWSITLFRSITTFHETNRFHKIFLEIFHIQFEIEKYHEIFYGILSAPQNTVMDLNNVTSG